MCSLCGILGVNEHWADAVARPGVYTRNVGSIDRRRERARRVQLANVVLAPFSMRLADWQGTSFVVSTLTGRSEIIEDLGHLWAVAERLSGRICDPLDPGLIGRMEAASNG